MAFHNPSDKKKFISTAARMEEGFRTNLVAGQSAGQSSQEEWNPTVIAKEVHPALKVYDDVKLSWRVHNKRTQFGSFSLLQAGHECQSCIHIDLSDAQLSLTIAELESIEVVVAGTACGGSNVLFTSQYELTPEGQVSTLFHDSPVPLRLVFNVDLSPDQVEQPDDLALDIDQRAGLERLEIAVHENSQWKKLLSLIERSQTDRQLMPRHKASWKSSLRQRSFRLSRRFSSRDLANFDSAGDLSIARGDSFRSTSKELRKALRECQEIKVQGPNGGAVYGSILLEPRIGRTEGKNMWMVTVKDSSRCSVKSFKKMEIHRGGIIYQLSDGKVKRDWLSVRPDVYKVHFGKSGLSWITIQMNVTKEDHACLKRLMSGSLAVELGCFLSVVDRSGIKCSVVDLAFCKEEVRSWFHSIGIETQYP